MQEKMQLIKDMQTISEKAIKSGYIFGTKDAFALGYMCAKSGIDKLVDNQEEVSKACDLYDETDDLGLMDTIGETLVDLEIIKK
jgi:hypothetical protein